MVAGSALIPFYTSRAMYHPTTRVLAVLELLQARGRMTGSELARRLEVDIRTLRRYVTMLQDLGVPVVAERGRNGAYRLGAGFKLPPMMFTNDEALALSVGLLAARRLGLAEAPGAVESARAKLERVLPEDVRERVLALSETVTLGRDEAGDAAGASPGGVLMALSEAARLGRRVHMRYRSARGDETEREFDPYGLTFYRRHWYAVGRCGMRRGLRSFRLDRVARAEQTDTRFDRPERFDAFAYVAQSVATLPRRFVFEVLLRADPAAAGAEVSDALGVLEPRRDGVLLRGTADDLDWLARELARLPFDFAVHGPEQLRAALRRRAAELSKVADSR